MLDNDYAVLARVQKALVDAQRMHDEEKKRLDRLATAGNPTDSANEIFGFLELYVAILQRHRDYLFATAARRRDRKR
jgi:hypothetical protein